MLLLHGFINVGLPRAFEPAVLLTSDQRTVWRPIQIYSHYKLNPPLYLHCHWSVQPGSVLKLPFIFLTGTRALRLILFQYSLLTAARNTSQNANIIVPWTSTHALWRKAGMSTKWEERQALVIRMYSVGQVTGRGRKCSALVLQWIAGVLVPAKLSRANCCCGGEPVSFLCSSAPHWSHRDTAWSVSYDPS